MASRIGNTVYLFGDIHVSFQDKWEIIKLSFNNDSKEITAFFQSYIHNKVWDVFTNSLLFYVELFENKYSKGKETIEEVVEKANLKHTSSEITQKVDSLSKNFEYKVNRSGNITALGLVDYLILAKTKSCNVSEAIPKIDGFIKEMEDLTIQKESLEILFRIASDQKKNNDIITSRNYRCCPIWKS